MKTLTLKQTIDGIKRRDNKILTAIYKEVFPVVRSYVQSNKGTPDDAQDVFQEAIIILFKQINSETFDIKTGFEAYLYGIARKVWLKMLRDRNIHIRNVAQIEEPEVSYNKVDEIIEDDFRRRLYRKYFLRLPVECQKVLTMINDLIPYKKIALKLGYKSEKIVRNKKYKCKETLIKTMSADPDFKSLSLSND